MSQTGNCRQISDQKVKKIVSRQMISAGGRTQLASDGVANVLTRVQLPIDGNLQFHANLRLKKTAFGRVGMAAKPLMLNCPACQHQISSSAFTCPSCGATLRKVKRGIFGKLVLWAFWAFNLLMIVWIWGGASAAIDKQKAMSGAEAAGAAIGTGIGVSMLLVLWVFGAVILGLMALLTRPKH